MSKFNVFLSLSWFCLGVYLMLMKGDTAAGLVCFVLSHLNGEQS